MFAGHDADVFAVSAGGNGISPGDALTIAQQGHTVDGFDKSVVVPQQNVADSLLLVARQIEGSGERALPWNGLRHTGNSVF